MMHLFFCIIIFKSVCDLCSLIYESIADAVDRVKYEANKITEGFDTLFK